MAFHVLGLDSTGLRAIAGRSPVAVGAAPRARHRDGVTRARAGRVWHPNGSTANERRLDYRYGRAVTIKRVETPRMKKEVHDS